MQTSQHLNRQKTLSQATTGQRVISSVVFLIIIGFFGVFAAAGHYKIDTGRWFGYCGFKQRTGLPCPTCGMTTATIAFAQGEILQAFYIQPAAGVFCVIIAATAFFTFFTAVFGAYFSFIRRFFAEVKARYIILALLVLIAAGWMVTLSRALAAQN